VAHQPSSLGEKADFVASYKSIASVRERIGHTAAQPNSSLAQHPPPASAQDNRLRSGGSRLPSGIVLARG